MKKTLMICAAAAITACSPKIADDMAIKTENPLLQEPTNKYELPSFSKIKYADYAPAVQLGIAQQKKEVEAIINNPEEPTFDNTILALDNCGQDLERATAVWGLLQGTDNTDELESVTEEILPLLTAAEDEIAMNDKLFARIKKVYDKRESLGLNTAQMRLLEKKYRNFVRSGALLSDADKEILKGINQEVSEAMKSFGQNILKETNAIEIYVDDESELSGLPANTIETAREEAKKRGHESGWSFTLHAPSRLAVLASADSRSLRERMYKAYTSLCSNNNEYNNEANINKILDLRYRKARLLGFNTFADFMLDNVMAKTVANAEELMYKLWEPAKKKVEEEVRDMQALADREGAGIKIAPWDYAYYQEKVKKERFNLSDDDIRPYFALDSVVKGMFYVANRLHGTTFTPLPDAPKYNPEVTVYDVKNAEGKHLAIFMTDYFPRETKRGGAWMSELKGESNINGVEERPIIYNVGNMTKPTKDTPSLLTLDEVETVFHEFGHGMHGMFTTAAYRSQSGTNVDRNMVELPSQINEHWATEPEVLKVYAKHYKTGEVIPDELIAKMEAAGKFNQGFMTTELVAASLLDLEWHKMPYTGHVDVLEFENKVSEKLGKPELVEYRYRSPYFRHIFASDGYASGYFTYLWAAVLDTDGFELFKERGIFDPATAKSYRENILEMGDSEDAMTLYVRFRGHKPSPDALLRSRGLME